MPYPRFSQTFRTTNATQQTPVSVPVPAGSSAEVYLDVSVLTANLSAGAAGEARALFRRPVGGNVTRATGLSGLLKGGIDLDGDFLIFPSVVMVANISLQTADVKFTGLSGATLNWTYAINVKRNSP